MKKIHSILRRNFAKIFFTQVFTSHNDCALAVPGKPKMKFENLYQGVVDTAEFNLLPYSLF